MRDGPDGWRPTLWEDVLDEVLAGLFHELNGRVAGLHGVFSVLQAEGPDEEMGSLLDAELDSLGSLVPLLRSLPRRPTGSTETFRVRSLVEPMARLAERRRGSGETSVEIRESDPAPVLEGDWNGWSRLLLALLTLACRAGDRGDGSVVVDCERLDGGEVRIGVRVGRSAEWAPITEAVDPLLDSRAFAGGAADRIAEARSMAAELGAGLEAAADPESSAFRCAIRYRSGAA